MAVNEPVLHGLIESFQVAIGLWIKGHPNGYEDRYIEKSILRVAWD
jgi:hypothetical protein